MKSGNKIKMLQWQAFGFNSKSVVKNCVPVIGTQPAGSINVAKYRPQRGPMQDKRRLSTKSLKLINYWHTRCNSDVTRIYCRFLK
jgi:hypothetical protein